MGSTLRSTLLRLRLSNGLFVYFVILYIFLLGAFVILTLFDLLW